MINLALERLNNFLELGGAVVGLLIFLSVLVFGITIWKVLIFELEGVGRSVNRGFLFRTLESFKSIKGNHYDARHRIYAKLDYEFGRVAAGLRFVDLTVQIAPLLGLFGTVLGMIEAFRTLQDAGSSADPSVLAGGIWVALLTTAAGLSVAIPASFILSWLDGRLESHRRTANEAVEQLFCPEPYGTLKEKTI